MRKVKKINGYLVVRFNERERRDYPQLGGTAITAAELAAGLVLNVWLGLGIWDYSGLFGNLWGQICPQFWALWCLLAGPVIVAFDWLDYLSGAGDRPSYKWI